MTHHDNRRSPGDFRVGDNGGYHRFYDSPPGHSPGSGSGLWPMAGGGGGFRPIGADARGYGSNHQPSPIVGHKRGYPFMGRGGSPDNFDNSNFAKLFVGSVPRTATEEDIRPLFENHGNVIEVALIKDKRTGQQQGCCFIKYATSEEADRAIRALHNQHTLPGSMGPVQVRYADGERERLGAVEFKLFVGSLNKQATEKEVEEIFSPYGRVEDVYLMRDEFKQSRGCGFVKYGNRDMALMAIKGLHGIYMMRGCDQPLTVRFADPKRPRSGDSRSGFGGPGPHLQAPLIDDDIHGLKGQLPPMSNDMPLPLNSGGPGLGGSLQGSINSSSTPKQSPAQGPPVGQQVSSLQKPFQSPPHFPPSSQLQRQTSASYSQPQASLSSVRPLGVQQYPLSSGQISYRQGPTSQQPTGVVSGQSGSQTSVPQRASHVAGLQTPLSINLQPHTASTPINQQKHSAPVHQSPSQLAQMLSQQTQTLQASFQSSQQAFSQLQQQLQLMQPSNQGLSPQQNSQASKVQWTGNVPHAAGGGTPAADVSSSTPGAFGVSSTVQALAPAKCNWTEHTSPDGYKYYYNSVTGESRWEKPEELTLLDQQQQKQSVQQSQTQSFPPSSSSLLLPQNQHIQFQGPQQSHIRSHQQLHIQQSSISSSYQVSGVASLQNIQEPQASRDWMWKNNPAGA